MNSVNSFYGFAGKLLKVNLSDEIISKEVLNRQYSENFMGGAGYACRYLFDHINKDTDPLSPENILMIMNGPFCLTSAPSFSRMAICTKSPLTGLWGEANAGGFFGAEMKRAGYDGIIIAGKSKKPVILKIIDGDAHIIDASEIWGKGTKDTHKMLKEISGNLKSKVLCIGQGGENLVKFANVNTEGRSAGRTGMGAVMGSKNLKGIVIKGNLFRPTVANPELFKEIVKKTTKFIQNTLATKGLREYGTSGAVMPFHSIGDLPIKYWSQGEWNEVSKIAGEKLKEEFYIKNKSCYGCGIACGKLIRVNNDNCSIEETEMPEYETIAGFGSMILNSNLESIAMANHLCNDYGLDTISCSSVIAFLYDLFNKNKITKNEVDGLELDWGNYNSMLKLIEKIAFRKGLGDLLAEGSKKVGEKFNIPSDEIAIINNQEVPYHDIRSCYGLSLTYAFAPRGACHTTGDVFKVCREGNEVDFSSIEIDKMNLFSNNKKMAKSAALLHDYRALYSSLISCFFSNPPPEYMAELIKNLFGIKFNLQEMTTLGERIFNMKRMFNIKMGLTSLNDTIPKILLNPTKEGAVKDKSPDFEKLRDYYYQVRDWNPKSGKPNSKKLKELGLDKLNI
ncbi:MAG: aldehyde ferredoxin oxidoreductase [Promethearchaeota archaeon]|nr:MAG: aldehyde ferredoxin oxidoreductase [Candidatus Lokiarchaeota archaeon]